MIIKQFETVHKTFNDFMDESMSSLEEVNLMREKI